MKIEKSYLKDPIRTIRQSRNNSENMIQFSDNKKYPILYQFIKEKRLKKSTPPSMYKGGRAIQLMSDDDLNYLYLTIVNHQKDNFKRKFRSIASGMDEEISCETTYNHAIEMLNEGKTESEIKQFLIISDQTRLPTGMTAHHVILQDGQTTHRMVHPTSTKTMMYGGDTNEAGNYRFTGHTSFDRTRASLVKSATSEDQMVDSAITFTLGAGAQPPFASNAVMTFPQTDPIAFGAHRQREELKKLSPFFDATKTQPFDAAWYPDTTKRSISPTRVFIQTERERIQIRLSGFKPKSSFAYKELIARFGNICHYDLLSIAQVLATAAGLTIDRDAKRRKSVLIKWFDENWITISPFLNYVVLE